MNKTNIEWTDFSWNPVTGCLHACRSTYCYNTMKSTSPLNRFGAQYFNRDGIKVSEKKWRKKETGKCHIAQKGEIYPFGYDPTFYPHRLGEPLKEKMPSRIFTVDTGDLFGEWVPEKWIKEVLDVIRKCPHHTFQLLTKNPKRYSEFDIPDNAWIGTTINSDDDKERVDQLRNAKAKVKYLSIEPLMGEVTISFDGLQWIIVGAMTGKNPFVPKPEWITKIIKEADRHDIPVFTKENIRLLTPEMRCEFPGRKYTEIEAAQLKEQ